MWPLNQIAQFYGICSCRMMRSIRKLRKSRKRVEVIYNRFMLAQHSTVQNHGVLFS